MTRTHLLLTTSFLVGACGAPPVDDDHAVTETDLVSATTRQGLHGLDGRLVPNTNALTEALYEHQSKRWIRWALGLPWSTGPINDTTGAACADAQAGPLWFLAGTSGFSATRSCTIPRGKFLFLPLINTWISPPNDYVDTPEELAEIDAFAEEYLLWDHTHACGLELRIDGRPLASEDVLGDLGVTVLDPFSITLDDDDHFQTELGAPGGPRSATWMVGHYALVTPLSPGHHTLELAGASCEDDLVTRWFETRVHYDLFVP